jgi:spore germination cell wall hydrolase CwlJ-like protein
MISALLFRWHTSDKGGLVFFAALASFAAVLGGIAGFAYFDQIERLAAAQRRADLQCLAENVYFEARGEPLAGQYAVAEVTMNRVASPLFPDTVCDVVHAMGWDPVRKRNVGAFSWTEFDSRPRPAGAEWRRAMAVAGTVYENQEAPLVEGALYYHATRITPAWARTKTQVARIGRHLFYE